MYVCKFYITKNNISFKQSMHFIQIRTLNMFFYDLTMVMQIDGIVISLECFFLIFQSILSHVSVNDGSSSGQFSFKINI